MTFGAKGWKNDDEKAFDAALGVRIRRLRESADMTRTTLASRIGVSFQQIGKYEAGMDRIAASRLLTMATALNVPASLLLEGELAEVLEARLTGRTGRLADLFERCEPDGQDILIALAETLASK
ncbi:MAG: XRE family transcriptional regulator [Comamonadaceae bacterium]|nr:MAG: XRE family transcriptional regulator [Comamonadaceae bacterium]